MSAGVPIQLQAAETPMRTLETDGFWNDAADVLLRAEVRIELPPTTLTQLGQLAVGHVLVSTWPTSEEVPLLLRGVALSWCEFDVLAGRMAVRLTRLG